MFGAYLSFGSVAVLGKPRRFAPEEFLTLHP